MKILSKRNCTAFPIDLQGVCVTPGRAVGPLVFDSQTGEFKEVTAREYNESIKQEQTGRLEKEGVTFEEYEKWANGWDWNRGYNVYHGDTRDESTLEAFLAVVRKRELDKAVAEYRRKPKAARRAPVLTRTRSRSRSVRRAGRHVSRSCFAVAADPGGGGDDGGGDGDGQSDGNKVAPAFGGGVVVVLSARLGGLSLNSRINLTATRKRALPALLGARCGGRVFCTFFPTEVAA